MLPPKINVTPLIDVLLVLLIIFMVIAPLKPSSFQAKIPSEPDRNNTGNVNPYTIVIGIAPDLALSINNKKSLGNVDNPDPLTAELKSIFDQREANGAVDENGNVLKTVFVKAPKNIGYGNVVKVIDAVKEAGAEPLALQIDYLD
jgi:biopolymer transport protein TolR